MKPPRPTLPRRNRWFGNVCASPPRAAGRKGGWRGGSCPAPPLRHPGRLPRPRREGCPASPMQERGGWRWGDRDARLHPHLQLRREYRASPAAAIRKGASPQAQPRGTCGPPPRAGGCPQRAVPPPTLAPVQGVEGAAPAPRPLAHLQARHAGGAGARTGGGGGRSAAPRQGHLGPRGGPLGGACPLPGAAS